MAGKMAHVLPAAWWRGCPSRKFDAHLASIFPTSVVLLGVPRSTPIRWPESVARWESRSELRAFTLFAPSLLARERPFLAAVILIHTALPSVGNSSMPVPRPSAAATTCKVKKSNLARNGPTLQ